MLDDAAIALYKGGKGTRGSLPRLEDDEERCSPLLCAAEEARRVASFSLAQSEGGARKKGDAQVTLELR